MTQFLLVGILNKHDSISDFGYFFMLMVQSFIMVCIVLNGSFKYHGYSWCYWFIISCFGFYSLNNSILYHGLYTIENGSFAHYDSIYIYMVPYVVLVSIQ